MSEKPTPTTETIVLHEIEDKTSASYQFAREGKPGNPTKTLHQKNFRPSKDSVIKMPVGSSAMIKRGDTDTIDELVAKAHILGLSGCYQVRRAYGGLGNGKSEALKLAIKSGQISTENTGFKVLLPELEL